MDALAGGDAKVLAGGQSLVPVLAMRLGRPGTLVDITRLPGLDDLEVTGGVLRIGAAVRQRTVERSDVARAVPLIGRAMPFVGHRELRSRGTVCGSLAHADPAAELPAVAACLDATVVLRGPRGTREVPARELVVGAMTTDGRPGRADHRGALPGGGARGRVRLRRDRATPRRLRAGRGGRARAARRRGDRSPRSGSPTARWCAT